MQKKSLDKETGTILQKVKGFTPVIDIIVEDLGLMPALVYGVMWRYCQMKDGVCKASLKKISERVGVSRKTVERYAKILCEEGYLEDLTPELRNRPHIYRDAGMTILCGLITAKMVGKTESRSG